MRNQIGTLIAAVGWTAVISLSFAACARSGQADNKAVAEEVSATWTRAFDAGDAAGLAALYAEDAHSVPPGSPAISG